MIDNNLDALIQCDIAISNPLPDSTGVNEKILVVAPKTTGVTDVLTITKSKDLLSAGFANTSQTYTSIDLAMKQTPCVTEFYVVALTGEETVLEAIQRAATQVDFYAVYAQPALDALEAPTTQIKAISDLAELNEKLFLFEIKSVDALTYTVFAGAPERTIAEFVVDAGQGLAHLSKCFGYTSGSETWMYQQLYGYTAAQLTEAQKTALAEKNVFTYLQYAGTDVTIGGKVIGGEWADVIRFRDWLKKKIQTEVFNLFRLNSKVPYTDAGIGLVQGAIESCLAEGQVAGGIAPDETDDDGNLVRAYSVTVPKASDLSEAERKSRKLSGVKWSAKLAGAIHLVEITGYLSF